MITFPAPCYPSNFQAITDLFSFPVQLENGKEGGEKEEKSSMYSSFDGPYHLAKLFWNFSLLCISSSFLFYCWIVFICIDIPPAEEQPPVEGHPHCFKFLAFTNKVFV